MVLWRCPMTPNSNISQQLKLFLFMSLLSTLPLNFLDVILKFPALLQVPSKEHRTYLKLTCFYFLELAHPEETDGTKSQALSAQAVSRVSLLSICSCSSPLPTPTSLHRDADLNQVLKGYTHSAWGKRGKQDLSDLSSKDQTAEQHAPSLYWTVKIFCVWEAQCQHEKLPLRTAA